MELLLRLFPYGKTLAGMRQACDHGHFYKDSTSASARRKVVHPVARSISSSLSMMTLGGRCPGSPQAGDPCSLFQTQAAQTMLHGRDSPVMPRMAILLGFMGIGMSGYSSRQLTLHCKPSSRLFR